MDKETLLKKLRDLDGAADPEHAHAEADKLLLEFINDEEITEAFNNLELWYA